MRSTPFFIAENETIWIGVKWFIIALGAFVALCVFAGLSGSPLPSFSGLVVGGGAHALDPHLDPSGQHHQHAESFVLDERVEISRVDSFGDVSFKEAR